MAALSEVGREGRRDLARAVDLVLVDRQPCHVGASRGDYAAERAADAAAHVEDAVHVAHLRARERGHRRHAPQGTAAAQLTRLQLLGDEILRVLDRLDVRLATLAEAKVKGVPPPVLVKVRREVVERVRDCEKDTRRLRVNDTAHPCYHPKNPKPHRPRRTRCAACYRQRP